MADDTDDPIDDDTGDDTDDDTDDRTYALGDDIDDWCTKCRGLSGHAVEVVEEGKPMRVRCRVCLSLHRYRKGKGGRSKAEERRKLIEEVMKSSPFRPPGGGSGPSR